MRCRVLSLDSNAVKAAAEYSARHRGVSFLAIQDRRTLLEQNAKTPHKIYSGTKAFWNLAALAAAEDGLLDLDDLVANTITNWRSDPGKSRVTIRQLLNFDSGPRPTFSAARSTIRRSECGHAAGEDDGRTGKRIYLWPGCPSGFSSNVEGEIA